MGRNEDRAAFYASGSCQRDCGGWTCLWWGRVMDEAMYSDRGTVEQWGVEQLGGEEMNTNR